MPNKVAILGAGMSGLVAAKLALEYGLDVVIFEKKTDSGGLWNPKFGFTWTNMQTNISKHTDVLPDFPWPNNIKDFPSTQDMFRYLRSYASANNLIPLIKFNTEITNIQQSAGRWLITTSTGSQEFDNVIIACGIFSIPHMPSFNHPNMVHSSQYKNAEDFSNLDVEVIGGGMSGIEIAANVATKARSVKHFFGEPAWIIPRYIGPQQQPLDLVFYTQPSREDLSEVLLKTALGYRQTNTYMSAFNPREQNKSQPALFINPKSTKPHAVAISDDYMRLVREDKIAPIRKRVTANDLNPAAHIISATGYSSSLSFFSSDILKNLNFNSADKFNPLVLYKTTCTPALPGLGFVGVYRGQYPQVIYQQAKWVARVFSGELTLPNKETMQKAMANELQIRELPREDRPQFPHPDYLGHLQSIRTEAEYKPIGMLYRYAVCARKNYPLTVLASVGISLAALTTMKYRNVN